MKYQNPLSKRAMLVAVMLGVLSLANHPLSAQTTYTWTNTAGGSVNWSTETNWSGGTVPSPVAGDTIDFSTINLAANAVLALNGDRTAGIWKFGDTSGSQSWTVSAGNTVTLQGASPAINIVNGTTTLNNILAGTNGFTKSGGGTLAITGTNTFSGNVTISGGTLTGLDTTTLAQAGSLIFTGTSGVTTSYGNRTFPQSVTVNSGVTATFNYPSNAYAFRFDGPVSGSGTISVSGASAANVSLGLYNTANTFTGTLVNPSGGSSIGGFRVGSLADSTNPIRLGAGALELVSGGVALTFNSRRIELTGTTVGATLINNTSTATDTFTVNTDLLVTGVGNKTLSFSGTNTSTNTFTGIIADGVGSVISVAKTGTGAWTLAGSTNTYTGPTTISAGTLAVTTIGNVGSGASSLGAPTSIANGTITLGSTTATGTLRYQGTGHTSDRVINLAGTTGGGGLSHMGSGLLKFTSNLTATGAGTKTLTLQGSTTGIGEMSGNIVDNSITNLTAVSKSGTGTWVLSGTNTHSGDTTLTGGVLRAAEGTGLSPNSALTLNGGTFEPIGNFARVAGNSAGKIALIGGASGFSARGGDVEVAIGTLGSPAALVMGSATFVPSTLVLNAATADSKLTFLNPVNISGFNFDVNVGAATAEMSGVLSGDLTGSVMKTGNGTLIFSGNNTFQGDVAINGGTLSLTQPSLSQYADVSVANGATLNLNFTGTTSVASLTLGDVPKAPGAYNSTNAAPFITGTGVIYVNGGDADEDGMPDGWELLYGFNPNDAADATADADGDGLTNLEEYVAATGPNNGDTDGDGLTDGEELHGIIRGDEVVFLGTSPLNPDTDADGVTDGEEVTAGSSPLIVDTDADGAPDWYEVKASFTNPALASSKPIVPYPLPRPTAAAGATNKPVKVFIMSGQSNMVGMGEISPLGTPGTLSTVVKQLGRFPNFVNADGSWSVNNDVYYRGLISAIGNGPLTVGFGSASTTVGPELGFGRVLGYALDEPVLLIKSSIGNRALAWDYLPPGSPRYTYGPNTYAGYGDATASWLTGSTPVAGGWYAGKQYDECLLNEADWSPTAVTLGSPPVDNVVDVLDDFAAQYPQWAAQGFEIAGYVWWQGNKDILTGPPYSTRYETNMVNFIKEVRSYYAGRYPGKCTTNTPFVLATGCGDTGTDGNGLVVANAQLAASDPALHPEFAGNVKTMDTRPYWRDAAISPDNEGYHYNRNAETYTLTGDALGRGMLELLGGITDTTPPALSALSPATTTTNVDTAVNFVATFDEVIVAGIGNLLLKNITDNTSISIPVTDAAQVTTFGSVLTLNPASYLKPNKQYAIQIPVGAIKDYSGNAFVGITDDVTWTFTSGQGDSLTAALIALTDHVNGVSILSAGQIAAHKATIEGMKDRMGEDEAIISSAFDLVRAYDTVYGALWVASGQMTRSAETGNLQWTIYRVMQAIMDYAYTRGNIVSFPELINGFKFNSSSNFPGVCPVPPSNNVYTVAVNASFTDTFGRDTQGWTDRARRPTGAYLAPGTIATVTVPATLVNAGYKIRVGAHSWDFSNKPYIKRLDRSTLQFDIIGTDVKIASPLGGGIYIETPMNANAGVVNVTITGAARAPFFQNTRFHQTTLAEWLATERTNPAPWADFQTDKFMMQVPRSWIYAHPDPLTVLNDWDSSMDATNDLMGFPHMRGKDTMYLQVDVFNKSSVYAPGYPTVNVSYSPTTDYGGYINNYLVRGPQYSPDYTFHEQGHSYFFPKFGGESESTVNLLYVPVLNQKFGESLDSAFKRSFGTYNPNIPSAGFKDNVATIWMTSFNFAPREVPMADWEKAYQHQGHAKFVDIAQLYGWGALNSFWYYYNYNDTYNIPVPKDNDSLMVKLCESAGADIRPLWHFWGVAPGNATNVASQVAGLGLTPPVEIYDLLMHYKSKLPTNNASYQAFCQLYYGRQPTMGGNGVEREHARQWSTTLLNGTDTQVRFPTEIYDEAAYTAAAARVQEILDLYYPTGRPPSNNARLADLQPSLGTLSPGFNGTTFSYSTVVPYSATSMTITPVASDPSATITVNGMPATSGAPSGAIDVSAATSVINIVVVSSDTTVTNTYTVTVTHAAASANANLANLVPSAGTLTPAFASGTTSYSATVPYAVNSLTLTPTTAQSGATITVNGSPVTSGAPSGAIALNVGNNIITLIVVAEDLSTSKTYTLTVLRTANADLSNLATSAGTLAPVFATATYNYTVTVSFGTSSLTVTPTAADPAASITVNGSAVSSGNPSGPISLIVGNNVITTVVVSQDQTTSNTYTLNVTRVAPGSRWWDGGTINIVGNGNGASAGGTGTWDTTIQNWDQGSNLPCAAWENGNGDTAVFAGTAGTVTLGTNASASGLRFDTASYVVSGAALTLTSPAAITANANATVSSALAGTNGLTKAGTATLTLAGSNTLSGGFNLNAGTVQYDSSSNANIWGASTNVITFTGNAALHNANNAYTLARGISINSGVTGTISGAFGESTNVTGVVSGSGTMAVSGFSSGWALTLSNTANTFNGPISITNSSGTTSLTVASLGDSTGAGSISLGNLGNAALFNYTGASSALLLDDRQFIMAGTTGGGTINSNSAGSNTLSISTNLLATGVGAKTLTLGGNNTGANTFAGNIVNGSATIALTKADGGAWIVSGANTYTGKTTISNGTLSFNSIANVGGGASALGAPTIVANGIIAIGSSTTVAGTLKYIGGGHTTDRSINLAATTTGGGTLDHSGTGLLKFTGEITNSGTTKTLTLQGSTAGTGELAGIISNGTGPLALTKTGAGTWKLSGNNSYLGTTTVSAGKLFINGDSTAATGALSVSANATLGGTGTIGGNTTIAANGKLEFALGTNAASHDGLDIAVGKSFGFSGASVLTITSGGGASPGTYTLITGGNNITGSAPVLSLPAGWTASVSISANSLLLNITSVGAPNLVSISDNMGGSTVPVNTPVTYTVTFSEDMDASTVTASDFGNAGSATVTFGTITETSPGVFTLQVTPTTAGTLQLQVNAGEVLADVAGYTLDTTTAIIDDTVIMVNTANAAPVWTNNPVNEVNAAEDAAYAATLADDASDANGNTLVFAKVSGPAWLNVAADGALSGTPGNSDVGPNSFTVSVSDGIAAAVEATINITVINVNDAPVWSSDPLNLPNATEDSTYLANLAGNAGDVDAGTILTFAKVSGPVWLNIAANGALSGTPSNSDVGANAFTVSVSDGIANPVTATLNITVINTNDAPIWASNPINELEATEDSAYASTLANDASDVDTGATLTYAKVSGPAWLNVSANGMVSGMPANSDVGANSFTVSVSDGIAMAVEATLSITVINTNDAPSWASAPVNGPDAPEDAIYSATLAASATDVDAGATLTFTKVSGPAWLNVAADGTLGGSPANSDVGTNAFRVSVSDGIAAAVEATLNITVINTNDAPIWASNPINELDATEDSAYASTLADDASDVDTGATLTFAKVSGPAWLNVSADGMVSGMPTNSDVGTNSFTVSASDGIAMAVEATLSITVINTNDAPSWASAPVNGPDATEDATYSATLAASATDVDAGANLTFTKVSGPAWLNVAADGTLGGSPANSDVGANAFTVIVSDGIAVAVEATLNITVINTNDAPTWASNPINALDATEDSAYTATLANDASDVDTGATLTYAKVSGPAWLSVAPTGILSGTPHNTNVGVNSFTVSVTDGIATTVEGTLNITVLNTNDAPTWATDPIPSINATEDAVYTGNLGGSASDVDPGAILAFAKVSGPAWLTVGSNGALSGTPANGDVGLNSFTVSVSDGIAASVVATLNIAVINTNDAPVFTTNPVIAAGASEGVAYTGQTLAGMATDADAGDSLTYSKVSGPAWLVVAPNGELSGTPSSGTAGVNSFVVRATDSASATADVTLQITVTELPLPWVSDDIGTGMLAGSTTFNAGTFTQAGSGIIGSTSDNLRFTYQTLTADGEIIARISSLQNTGNSSRVGVMIRDSLAANSKQIFMGMTGSGAYRWVRRTTTGGSTSSSNSSTGTVPDTWVRLVRSGTTITAYKSTNGASWTTVGSTTNTTFASTCYIGLAVGSGSASTLNTSQFSNLSVNP